MYMCIVLQVLCIISLQNKVYKFARIRITHGWLSTGEFGLTYFLYIMLSGPTHLETKQDKQPI